MSNYRKPACIFYYDHKCVLKRVKDGSLEKFDQYGGWNADKATEFEELRGCPFIRRDEENHHHIKSVREECENCSARIEWAKQHQQDTDAQRLEDRSF